MLQKGTSYVDMFRYATEPYLVEIFKERIEPYLDSYPTVIMYGYAKIHTYKFIYYSYKMQTVLQSHVVITEQKRTYRNTNARLIICGV